MKLTKIILSMLSTNLTFTSLGILYGLLFSVLLGYVFFIWSNRKTYFPSDGIPAPFNMPVIGYWYKFAMLNSDDLLEFLYNIQEKYNGLLKIWLSPKLIYIISKPEHCEKILNNPKSMEKDYLYKFINDVTGPGLMTANVNTWKKHRKVIMPAFNQKILDSFVEIFAEQSTILNEQLDKEVGNRDIDLLTYISRCTLDIICETAMGIKMEQQIANSDFTRNLDRIAEIIQYRIFHVWYHFDFTFNLFPMSREFKTRLAQFYDFTSKVVKAKLEAREQKLNKLNHTIEDETSTKLAFLDLILENSNFTFQELMDEVNIFIIAGSDTSAVTISSILMMMGMYPEVQQEVLEEILEVIGPDREVLPSDLPRLKYMERVIKECARLFPVGAYFIRYLDEDVDLGDVVIPGGSSVFFNVLYINRNPKYWPDPLKFDPDRFLPENVEKRHPCTYLSFSYGPRGCIGARYAMLNMKVMLATILRKFKVHCDYKTIEEIRLKAHIVLRHTDGCKVWFERRQ